MTREPDTGGFTTAEILYRCGRTVGGLLRGDVAPAHVDAAVADLRRLPEDLPERGQMGMALVTAILRTSQRHGEQYLRHLPGLVDLVDRRPPTGTEWARLRPMALALSHLHDPTDLGSVDAPAMLAQLDELGGTLGDDPRLRSMQQVLRLGARYIGALKQGDEATLREVTKEMATLHEIGGDSPFGRHQQVFVQAMKMMNAHRQGDNADTVRAWDQFRSSVQDSELMPFMAQAMSDTETAFDVLRQFVDPADGQAAPAAGPTDEQLASLRALAERPGTPDAQRTFVQTLLGASDLRGGRETDIGKVEAGITKFRQVLAEAPADDPRKAFHLLSLGLALLRRSEVTGRVDGLPEAARLITQAREMIGGPHDPLWSLASETLSAVNRRLGETGDARASALAGLRRYAWNVLLQSDPAAAGVAARDAADAALDIARQCLMDNEPADAIQALDAGRGLVLFAATELRDVGTRLTAAGHGELAQRWQAATADDGPAQADTELRREVLSALSQETRPATGTPADPLDPPSVPEIQQALRATGADALVYLVPGASPQPGWALFAPADGPPGYLALPYLLTDGDDDVARHLAALSTRDVVLAASRGSWAPGGDEQREMDVKTSQSRAADSLDALCDWAWRAAIGPLLEHWLSRRPAAGTDHPPRIVLVPMGHLARVPWAAARRADGRYAVQLARFSQAASARMLCDSAALPPVPLAPVGLVVGDPDTADEAAELTAARAEAYAIRQAFYPGARYVGRRPDGSTSPTGPGTSDEVRDWLTSTRPGAGAMLHLSCHGVVQADPEETSSYLLLAGGDRLTAEELTGLLAGAPQRQIGLVVLAACRTGVSGRGYDEAYSLATTFLAGGVRSAISTQWSIGDRTTSLMMFMFHHFLRTERCPVREALRRAQLWMLDPDREPPAAMPAPLRRHVTEPDLAHVIAWAGFVHWGQ
ncbi:CHAT domain-containing protein [Solwaraspora sp. WMMB335]|uniref:CHAT domain-containing protein n=1 Tax=Solwaraspora sp. WMMB335 TaxID=3404118 RepID=UPI003B954D5C